MNVKEAIEKRRAYRSLDPAEITEEVVEELARAARMACSCFNNQPWRYVFVYEEKALKEFHKALAGGNEWATHASMLVAVFSRPDFDCQIKERDYFLFDTGIGTGFMILRATEMGLVAHPMAGFNEEKAGEILGVPEDMRLITIIAVSKHSGEKKPYLDDEKMEVERNRPERKPLSEIAFMNKYTGDE